MKRLLIFGFVIALSGISASENADSDHTLAYLSPQPSVEFLSPLPTASAISPPKTPAPAGMVTIPEVIPFKPKVPRESLPAALLGTLGMAFLLLRRRGDHA